MTRVRMNETCTGGTPLRRAQTTEKRAWRLQPRYHGCSGPRRKKRSADRCMTTLADHMPSHMRRNDRRGSIKPTIGHSAHLRPGDATADRALSVREHGAAFRPQFGPGPHAGLLTDYG